MNRRIAVLLALGAALALALPLSLVALASPPAGPAAAPLAAPADPPSITASGTGVLASGGETFFAPQTLNVTVQSKATVADVDAIVAETETRLGTIKSALVAVGVPAAGIRFLALNLQPQYGPPAPGEKGQPIAQPLTGFMVSASLTADVPDTKLLVAAFSSAAAKGATSVYSGYGKGGPQPQAQPTAEQLQLLAADALRSARAAAEALADASGKKLGALRSISSQQVYGDCCPPGNGWRMQLVATYDIGQ